MSFIFIKLYRYFSTRQYWLWLAVGLVIGGAIWTMCNAELEEDITKIMPTNEAVEKFNQGFLMSELSNRIVVHLYQEDDSDANGERLKSLCQAFVDSLSNRPEHEWIKGITYRIDESLFQSLSSSILDHIPIFLEESDYDFISREITQEAIAARVNGSYKALISPASFAIKDIIRRDPIGLLGLGLSAVSDFQLDDNFTLDDGYIMTKDKRHVLFFITPSTHAQESTKNGRLMRVLGQIKSEILQNAEPNIRLEYFGGPAISVANALRIKKDVTITVAMALFALLFLIFYYYKRIKIFAFILLPVITGAAVALLILAFVKSSISIISIGVGSVLIGITIDYSIHLFTHYKQKRSVTKVLSDVSSPLLISCLTTSSAFLCLYLVRSEALHDLGLFAALSVVCVGLLALILLPHFLDKGVNLTIADDNNWIDRLASYPYHQNKGVVISFLIFVIGCSFFVFNTQFETDLNKVNYMPNELIQAEENINKISTATQRSIYLVALGNSVEDAIDVSEGIRNELIQMKIDDKIQSFTSPNSLFQSQDVQQERINRWNTFWSPQKKDQLKQDIIAESQKLKFTPEAFSPFFALIDKSYSLVRLNDVPDLADHLLQDYIIDHDSSAAVMTLVRLTSDEKKGIHDAFVHHNNVSIVDKEFIVQQFVDILKSDFDKLVWMSLIIVFLILHLVYGRLELAIVAITPIICSWLITLGLMNILDLKFNIVNVIITSFIFGLGIDYSIFILRGLMQKYKYGEESIHSYKSSILLSSTTTLIGIGVLIFAKHPALQSIAAISIIGICSVLACSFVLEPLLFNYLTYKKGVKREFPLTVLNMGKTIWVYFMLVVGCIVISLSALILTLLFFIPAERKKTIIHYLIYGFSKLFIKGSFLNKVKYNNSSNEDFTQPAMVVANHKSLIDTPLFFQLTPKIIIITNDWVNKHPLYRFVCKMADFYSISDGADHLLDQLRDRVNQGYSIAIFPEGSRSVDEKIQRFRKGAFYLAEQLNLDIVPMLIHGTGPFLKKGSFWGRANPINVEIMERRLATANNPNQSYREQTKYYSRQFKKWYSVLDQKVGDVDYHAYNLRHNYLYKGPLTEWYMRIKTKLDGNYKVFDDLIPKRGNIVDIGCGYGYLTYILALRSDQRNIIGIDYDEEKIQLAKNCMLKNERISFDSADIMTYDFNSTDVFILSDMIHYLIPTSQYELLDRCVHNLSSNGMIIIRDGDRDKVSRHRGTALTELFSTRLGFNKTKNELHFISGRELEDWAISKNMIIQRVDQTKFTSNVIFVLKKNLEEIG